MIKTKKIAFLVDNPFRDLPGLILCAAKIASEGYRAYLIPMNLRSSEIWPLQPDFILLNHFKEGYDKLVKDLQAAKISIGILETEGSIYGPMPPNSSKTLNGMGIKQPEPMDLFGISMSKDPSLRRQISLLFAWCQEAKDHLVKRGWYDQNQIEVTGPPRMDLYSSPWSVATKSLWKRPESISSEFVLVNSSFPLVNSTFESPEIEARNLVVKYGYNEEFVDEWVEKQKIALDEVCTLVRNLADYRKDLEFVVRPHPFEKTSTYNQVFDGYDNIHVIKEGTVDGWILNSLAVIHFGSSTGLEAIQCEKVALSPAWVPRAFKIPCVESSSYQCADLKEFKEVLDWVVSHPEDSKRFAPENTQSILTKSFHHCDGKAHKRVCNAILSKLETKQDIVDGKFCEKLHVHYPKEKMAMPLSIAKRLAGALSGKTSNKILWDESEKKYSLKDVQRFVSEYSKVDSSLSDVQVEYPIMDRDYSSEVKYSRTICLSPGSKV